MHTHIELTLIMLLTMYFYIFEKCSLESFSGCKCHL